jgi:glucose/arabinose dehydrogenase
MEEGYTDEWCRANTERSVVSMPSHSAPLGIVFYDWKNVTRKEYDGRGCTGGFPAAMDKFAFIAFHGSWNRDPPTGYKVVFVPLDEGGNAIYQPIDLFRHGGETAEWKNGAIRPVDVQFDSCGRLYVTEDGTGSLILITYDGDYFEERIEVSDVDVADGVGCRAVPFPSLASIVSSSTFLRVKFMPIVLGVASLCLSMFLL